MLSIDLYWLLGNALGVIATACLTVSNKALLTDRLAGPGKLLLLHRVTAFIFWRLTFACKGRASGSAPPPISLGYLCITSLVGNASIVMSFLVLQEASVAFHQISRLVILPLSACVDLVLYGKRRSALEYVSVLLISYSVFAGARGEVTATSSAIFYAGACAVCTLGSSTLCGHIIKSTGTNAREFLDLILPYEIGAALALVIVFEASSSSAAAAAPSTPAPAPTDSAAAAFSPWYLASLCLNCLLACLVIFLTTWSQGNTSNML